MYIGRVGRLIGYALMVLAALLAVLERRGAIDSVGPLPVVAAALFVGMIGVMLVFTDLMVRGLYAQVDAAGRAQSDQEKDSDDED
jgi:hypothetical protein